MKLIKNDKLYRYTDDGSLIMVKLKKIKNEDKFIVYDDNKEEYTLNAEEIKKYTKLKPNGFISITCVGLEKGLRDVIVSYYKREDIDKEGKIPYVICRQNIIDVFNIGSRDVIGATVSQATCPKGIDFKTLILAKSIESIENISYYVGDSLDDVLYPVNTLNADDLLKENKAKADMEEDTPPGFCTSVRELLETNQFMFEVLFANNIYQVPHVIEIDEEGKVDEKTALVINKLFNDIPDPSIIPYTLDIDRSKIERDYYILSDKEYNLFILTNLK